MIAAKCDLERRKIFITIYHVLNEFVLIFEWKIDCNLFHVRHIPNKNLTWTEKKKSVSYVL